MTPCRAVVCNIPIACNRATADFTISSPLLADRREPVVKDYGETIHRTLGQPGSFTGCR